MRPPRLTIALNSHQRALLAIEGLKSGESTNALIRRAITGYYTTNNLHAEYEAIKRAFALALGEIAR